MKIEHNRLDNATHRKGLKFHSVKVFSRRLLFGAGSDEEHTAGEISGTW